MEKAGAADERVLSCAVDSGRAGLTLSAFLASRFPYRSEPQWAAMAAAGAVLVNGGPAAAGMVLSAGYEVRYRPASAKEPPVDGRVAVLYEDADIMVVNKSGNLPVHPAGRYFRNTLWRILREELGVPEPSIINRLDRETSGVVLAARNRAAAAACRLQFDRREVGKAYLVLTEGGPAAPLRAAGYMTACAGSAIRKKRLFVPSASPAPEPGRASDWAETFFTPLRAAGELRLLRAEPRTGRLHQIRATLLALGWPVAGDKMYGRDEGLFLRFLSDGFTPEDRASLRIGRQALHASELSFRHPSDGRRMSVKAPLPADMAALCGEI